MPLTILVADDEPGIRLSVSDYLEMSGYSVIAAENGQKALEMLEEYQPHLIVTDITMPEMDGYELVRRVRQRPAFRLLPVIFLTARIETQERIRGYQIGADLYLPKPFDLEELGAVIRNLLDRSQMMQAEWRSRSSNEGEGSPTPAKPLEGNEGYSAAIEQFGLTQRELEVLKLLTDGMSNVHLSPRTVEKYVSSLLRKTETSNRAELVRVAFENHLID
jgi:DNA-binding NarL/FixJ family response regulator